MAAPAIRLDDPSKVRFEVRRLERALSTTPSSLGRGPLEDALRERRAQLASHYRFVRGLRGGGNPKTPFGRDRSGGHAATSTNRQIDPERGAAP